MGRTTRTWRLAALAAAMGVTACAGGGGDDGSPTTTAPSEAEALVERLGCTSATSPGSSGDGWLVDDVRDCVFEPGDGWGRTLRLYGGLTPEERDAAVRLLTMDGGGEEAGPLGQRCAWSDTGVAIVAGDDWAAAVPDDGAAALVAERLDGEVQPGRVSVPVSTSPMECFPP